MLTCTNGVLPNHLPVIVASNNQHIIDTCPLTKFEGGLNLLHKVDDDSSHFYLALYYNVIDNL